MEPLSLTAWHFGGVRVQLTSNREHASRVSQIAWSQDLRQALVYVEDVRRNSWRAYYLLLERESGDNWNARRYVTRVWVN